METTKKINEQDRRWFIKFWANYVLNNPDWSKQQKVLIDSQIQSARAANISAKDYLKMKGEICFR